MMHAKGYKDLKPDTQGFMDHKYKQNVKSYRKLDYCLDVLCIAGLGLALNGIIEGVPFLDFVSYSGGSVSVLSAVGRIMILAPTKILIRRSTEEKYLEMNPQALESLVLNMTKQSEAA